MLWQTRFWLGCLRRKNLHGLEQLCGRKMLTLASCRLSTIEALEGAKNLNCLNLSGNTIRNLTVLGTMPMLADLNLSHNAVNDLSALANLENLSILDVSYNAVSTLTPLAKCVRMTEIRADHNQLINLVGLENMSLIVDAMAKLFAPILAFTCDEIWQSMPHREGDDVRNVLLNQMPENFEGYCLDEAAMEKWATVMKLRQDVNGILEKARADKRIGKALEAHVSLSTENEALKAACEGVNLAEIFIVSSCDFEAVAEGSTEGVGVNFNDLTVGVTEARGEKCPRCWMHSEESGADGLCKRCASVISQMDIEI